MSKVDEKLRLGGHTTRHADVVARASSAKSLRSGLTRRHPSRAMLLVALDAWSVS